MNLYYKNLQKVLIAWLLSNLATSIAQAVSINAIYYASCAREVGVIIDVNSADVAILGKSGRIKRLKRYDIIYIAQYPSSEIPKMTVKTESPIKILEVSTLFANKLVPLVKGWPIDFSEEKISFLSLDGGETIIDRNNIWRVDSTEIREKLRFTSNTIERSFQHPYPFSQCPLREKGQKIYPQQLLGNRLSIKNELDRLQEGYEKVIDYEKDQRFYPIPQLYENKTILSLWYNYGSRHGKSQTRNNDFVPAIKSTLSEGPFGFQRKLITGSYLMFNSFHEEPQTQLSYSLKADYVHFSYFYDIDRLLIGEEPYKWKKDDLTLYDDRINEVHHLGGGFDFGNYALGLTLSTLQYAARHDDSFFVHRLDMTYYDLAYQNKDYKIQLFYGSAYDSKEAFKEQRRRRDDSSEDENEPPEVKAAREALELEEELKPAFSGNLSWLRLNFDATSITSQPKLSLIYRDLTLYRQQDQNTEGELTYASKSFTVASYFSYSIDDEIGMSGYLAREYRYNRSGISFYNKETTDVFIKAGINWFLSF